MPKILNKLFVFTTFLTCYILAAPAYLVGMFATCVRYYYLSGNAKAEEALYASEQETEEKI